MLRPTSASLKKLGQLMGYLKDTKREHRLLELSESGQGLVVQALESRWLMATRHWPPPSTGHPACDRPHGNIAPKFFSSSQHHHSSSEDGCGQLCISVWANSWQPSPSEPLERRASRALHLVHRGDLPAAQAHKRLATPQSLIVSCSSNIVCPFLELPCNQLCSSKPAVLFPFLCRYSHQSV